MVSTNSAERLIPCKYAFVVFNLLLDRDALSKAVNTYLIKSLTFQRNLLVSDKTFLKLSVLVKIDLNL